MARARSFFLPIALLAAMTLCLPLAAQFWQQKKPAAWSSGDCKKLLTNSPWAKTYVAISDYRAIGSIQATPLRITYVAQLWSARVVREAMVRNAQLDAGYAQLGPAEKQAQDEEAAKFIAADTPDRVIVQVLFAVNKDFYAKRLNTYWQERTVATLRNVVALAGPRGRVAPVGFTPPTADKAEMQFVFPRLMEGKPIVEPGDAALALEIDMSHWGVMKGEKVRIEFAVSEMTLDGKLLY